jgi:hypothetical protein
MDVGTHGDVYFGRVHFINQESATMRTLLRGMVGIGLVALCAGPALAQGQGRGFGMFGGGGIGMLIGNESVQKELKLDDKQAEKAKELADNNREKMSKARDEFQNLDQAERREKFQALAKEMNEATKKAIGEFLKTEQITRLHQISNQVRGAIAFSDPEVAKKLGLTDTQKSDIQAIIQDSMEQGNTIRQENSDDREAMMKKFTELRKETLAKATAKLNDEQQKTWKELIGSPFEIKFQPRPGGN